jgi:lantibiotic modifying enzyme
MTPDFLETAGCIGARLCRDAIWSGGRCNWLGSYPAGGKTVHRALDASVYNGTSGIAMFLSQLFRATGERIFRITADGALRHALSRKDELASVSHPGFYSGSTGVAYAAIVSGEALGRPEFVEAALAAARGWPVDSAPEALDIMAGAAGAIPALLRIHQAHGGDSLLACAIRLGDTLLTSAHRGPSGWSWTTLSRCTADLTGFAHGAAGIAWALLELFDRTGEPRFRSAAEEGFRYERNCFSPEHENWPDFRSFEQRDGSAGATGRFCTAWCHGAGGIGLSRLRAWQILGQDLYRDEAKVAIQTTARAIADTREGSYCLCHGHSGNSELLLCASQLLDAPEYAALAQRVGSAGIERYERKRIPWPGGGPSGHETPDLMLGLAGIGYFYLRLSGVHLCRPILILLPDSVVVQRG